MSWRAIWRRLRSAGLDPVSDLKLHPGEEFSKRVGEVIRSSDAVIFLLTPAALDSPWTAYEIGVADGADKPIIPVVAGAGGRPLPPLLESYQTIPYDQLDKAFVNLAHRLLSETATS
jgi:nucleoside 2-deoxyribosyltransferase